MFPIILFDIYKISMIKKFGIHLLFHFNILFLAPWFLYLINSNSDSLAFNLQVKVERRR
jgi:hypothetical protein